MTILAILLVAFLLFILFLPWIKQTIEDYFRAKKYLPILTTINTLYADADPFTLSLKARQQASLAPSFTYGEISLCALLDLLEKTRPQKNDTFYDLGSGCGKTLIAVKLRYPFLNVKGIECLPVLHTLAQEKLRCCQQLLARSSKPLDITLLCDNILNASIADATLVFINATGYDAPIWGSILEKLYTLNPKTRIIITSKILPEPMFKCCYQGMQRMSWGLTSTYIYEKMM